MEDVKRDEYVHKVEGHMHKTRVLTFCCCAGSGEGVMEDVKRDKYVHKVDGHMHTNKSTYHLLLQREWYVMEDIKETKYIKYGHVPKRKYSLAVVVEVVVKVSWRM